MSPACFYVSVSEKTRLKYEQLKRLIVCPERHEIVEDLDLVTLGIRCPDLNPVYIAHLGGNR